MLGVFRSLGTAEKRDAKTENAQALTFIRVAKSADRLEISDAQSVRHMPRHLPTRHSTAVRGLTR